MTIKELVKALCKAEGKKKQVNVAQMTEVVCRLADVMNEPDVFIDVLDLLAKLGDKRAEQRMRWAKKRKRK